MTLNDRYRQFLKQGCVEGRAWAKNRSLVQAWRDCRNGMWISFWVHNVNGAYGSQDHLAVFRRLRDCATRAGVKSGLFGFCEPDDPATLARYADNVRAAFYPSGRLRP